MLCKHYITYLEISINCFYFIHEYFRLCHCAQNNCDILKVYDTCIQKIKIYKDILVDQWDN